MEIEQIVETVKDWPREKVESLVSKLNGLIEDIKHYEAQDA